MDAADIRQRMGEAVRSARTGTAMVEDPDTDLRIRFTVTPSGTDVELVGVLGGDDPGVVVRVVDGRRLRSHVDLPGVWDEMPVRAGWVGGDPLRLVEALPDGEAPVVGRRDGTTTYALRTPHAALADFCGSAYRPERIVPELETRYLWTLDDQDRPLSVRPADDTTLWPWARIDFGEWATAEPVTAPVPSPADEPTAGPSSGPGGPQLDTLAAHVARHLGRRARWSTAFLVAGTFPTAPGARTYSVDARFWLLRSDASGSADGPDRVVDGTRWTQLSAERLLERMVFVDALSWAPRTVPSGGRANLLLVRVVRRDDGQLALTYGWTHDPAIDAPDAHELLADAAWVARATAARMS